LTFFPLTEDRKLSSDSACTVTPEGGRSRRPPRAEGLVRVAAVQAPPVFLDLAASQMRAVELIEKAAAGGARLVAFAEAWLPGYPEWIVRGAPWEDHQFKVLFARLSANSVEVADGDLRDLCAAAARHEVVVVIGVTERDTQFSRGTLYNSLVLIDATGSVQLVHRKLIPTHAEKIVWGAGDASGLRVRPTSIGRVGGLICWEHWMPLARFALHAQGEQIHVAVWPDLPEMNLLATRSYAFEGRCFVVAPGTRLLGSDLPQGMPAAYVFGREPFSPETVLLKGGSVVVGPDGLVLAEAAMADDLLFADLDLGAIAGEQQAMDVAGHYNRPDLFRLEVNALPAAQISFTAASGADGTGGTPPPAAWSLDLRDHPSQERSKADGPRVR